MGENKPDRLFSLEIRCFDLGLRRDCGLREEEREEKDSRVLASANLVTTR